MKTNLKTNLKNSTDAGNSSKTKGSAMPMQQIVAKQLVSACRCREPCACYAKRHIVAN